MVERISQMSDADRQLPVSFNEVKSMVKYIKDRQLREFFEAFKDYETHTDIYNWLRKQPDHPHEWISISNTDTQRYCIQFWIEGDLISEEYFSYFELEDIEDTYSRKDMDFMYEQAITLYGRRYDKLIEDSLFDKWFKKFYDTYGVD